MDTLFLIIDHLATLPITKDFYKGISSLYGELRYIQDQKRSKTAK